VQPHFNPFAFTRLVRVWAFKVFIMTDLIEHTQKLTQEIHKMYCYPSDVPTTFISGTEYYTFDIPEFHASSKVDVKVFQEDDTSFDDEPMYKPFMLTTKGVILVEGIELCMGDVFITVSYTESIDIVVNLLEEE
jgi:hypothetical protein